MSTHTSGESKASVIAILEEFQGERPARAIFATFPWNARVQKGLDLEEIKKVATEHSTLEIFGQG